LRSSGRGGLGWGRIVSDEAIFRQQCYFGAQSNDGFELYKSIEHRSDLPGHRFSYSDRNAFLISIETSSGENKSGMSQ
jgi:hypothetical protein